MFLGSEESSPLVPVLLLDLVVADFEFAPMESTLDIDSTLPSLPPRARSLTRGTRLRFTNLAVILG